MAKLFPKVRTMSNIDLAKWSEQYGVACPEPSLAVQSQKKEADINTIVRNFGVTGKVPVNTRVPMYGDFTEVGDYKDAMNAMKLAEESFMAMPSDLRKRLDNDPQRFLEWCADSANLEEMRKLGLAVPAPVPSASEAS